MLGRIRGTLKEVSESSLLGSSTERLAVLMVSIGAIFSFAMFIMLVYWDAEELHESG
jgi:hypothetical protein